MNHAHAILILMGHEGVELLHPLLIFGACATNTYSSMFDYHMCMTGLLIPHYWTTFRLSHYLDT